MCAEAYISVQMHAEGYKHMRFEGLSIHSLHFSACPYLSEWTICR